MPGGDGTGPYGHGSVTGRGAGYCSGFRAPGFASSRARGGYYFAPGQLDPARYLSQDLEVLRREAELLQARLDEIKGRLKDNS